MLKRLASGPYLVWISMFVIIPILMILGFSLVSVNSNGNMQFSFENFSRAFDPTYISVLGRSLKIAVEATVICFVLGYPMAMIRSEERRVGKQCR